jgi:BirA family transcriptional regulator, biotin operon repressor / biotin---[acetyl-CoA-carboxylase] ligase
MLLTLSPIMAKYLEHFDTIESTHTYAISLLSKTSPQAGSCIFADFQTAGRGQIGRYWHSQAHQNLLLSYIIYPTQVKIDDRFYLNRAVALAVTETISVYVSNVTIKWPNDIYIDHKKVCGILIHNHLRGDKIASNVISIGINVLQEVWPEDLPNPTSIVTHFPAVDRMQVFQQLNDHLDRYIHMLTLRQYEALDKAYLHRLYRIGETHRYQSEAHGVFYGAITGVTHEGKLIIHTDKNEHLTFDLKEVSYLWS